MTYYLKFLSTVLVSVLCLCFSLSPTLLQAQIAVSAEVDSTNMLIGDQLKLHLFANHSPDISLQKVDLSPFEAEEEIEIITEGEWDTLQKNGTFVLQKDLVFTIFDSGYYWLPELPISYTQNGITSVSKTTRIPIQVGTVSIADTLQLAPIKGIIREKANWRDYLPFIVSLLSLGLVVGLIYYFRKKKANAVLPPAPEIKLPAHEIALTALDQLKAEQLWQQGDIKSYQSRLTYTIREYLENRYDIPALESTTEEIQRNLKQVDFDNSWKDKLRNILQVADLVKFAKAKPAIDFHDQVWQEAKDFVVATKAKVVIEEDAVDGA